MKSGIPSLTGEHPKDRAEELSFLSILPSLAQITFRSSYKTEHLRRNRRHPLQGLTLHVRKPMFEFPWAEDRPKSRLWLVMPLCRLFL